ncbi:MAG: nucleotide exchange factor GrpE [Gammaproteobacteria bacterium]
MSGKKNTPRDIGEIETEQEIEESDSGQEQADSTTVEATQGDAGEDEAMNEFLIQEIEVQKQAAAENLEKAMRAQAEMDNLYKRTARDIENAYKYALDNFVSELLPVLDSMELGISASGNAGNIDDLHKGMDLTLKMFITVMEKFGVKVIDPQGDKFNPEQHEAISMLEVEGFESGTVATVVKKGYELNGRLVRAAMVVVAK